MSGGYPQQGSRARPPTNWSQPCPYMQQPSYGYPQPGAYPGPLPQYNMNQIPYPGYAPQPTPGAYPTGWDQSTASQNQQTSKGSVYDYYNQQQPPQQGPGAPADGSGYNYPQGPSYGQYGYGGYQAQSGLGYDQQQQGYNSTYGNASNPTPDTHTPSYGTQGESNQEPAPGQSYNSNYTLQASTQTGYGVLPPSSQGGYGSYGAPQAPKPPSSQSPQQSPSSQGGGYVQPGYPYSQLPPVPSGYAQTGLGSQKPPSSGYPTPQPGYGVPPYGAAPAAQPSYGQQRPPVYGSSYGGGYVQPPAYASDVSTADNTRGTSDATPPPQPVQPSDAANSSPPS